MYIRSENCKLILLNNKHSRAYHSAMTCHQSQLITTIVRYTNCTKQQVLDTDETQRLRECEHHTTSEERRMLGGIISGGSLAGGSTPFSFCCIRYIASAN